MKKIYGFFICLFLLASCQKMEETAEPSHNNGGTTIDPTTATLLSEGTFVSSAHTTSGTVKLYETATERALVFENFKTDAGPDLRIYLSVDNGASSFYDLGVLKSTNGNFQYTFPKTVNITDLKKTLIWCRQFSVLFGVAQLN
jgi:hypothetical protein